jgi:hypothetical protein
VIIFTINLPRKITQWLGTLLCRSMSMPRSSQLTKRWFTEILLVQIAENLSRQKLPLLGAVLTTSGDMGTSGDMATSVDGGTSGDISASGNMGTSGDVRTSGRLGRAQRRVRCRVPP